MWKRAGLVSTVLSQAGNGGKPGRIAHLRHQLTDLQIKEIEGYLAYKWGLQGSFATPPPNLSFPSDSPGGNGFSFDLSDAAVARISTGGTEDVFDGGSGFSTSLWVKGWPANAEEALLTKKAGRQGFMETSVHGWMLRTLKTLSEPMELHHPLARVLQNGTIYPEIITMP